MNDERLAQVRDAMAKDRIDACVCRLPENIVILSGYWPLCGDAYLALLLEGSSACVVPETQEEEASSELWSSEILCHDHGKAKTDFEVGEHEVLVTRTGMEILVTFSSAIC